jgi:hypothetical protein
MRLSILLLLTGFGFMANAQNDDLPDYRKKWESFSKVPEKDIRRDLAAFTYGGVDESMGKLPLRSVRVIGFKDNTMKFDDTATKVLITTGTFEPAKHKLFYTDIEKKQLRKINGKGFFGNYGTMPKVIIASVTMIIGKDTVRLPQEALAGIYDPKFVYKDKVGTERTLSGVYYSPDKVTMYIHFVNRDVPDKYEVTWIIRDKKYLKRVVDYDLP